MKHGFTKIIFPLGNWLKYVHTHQTRLQESPMQKEMSGWWNPYDMWIRLLTGTLSHSYKGLLWVSCVVLCCVVLCCVVLCHIMHSFCSQYCNDTCVPSSKTDNRKYSSLLSSLQSSCLSCSHHPSCHSPPDVPTMCPTAPCHTVSPLKEVYEVSSSSTECCQDLQYTWVGVVFPLFFRFSPLFFRFFSLFLSFPLMSQ